MAFLHIIPQKGVAESIFLKVMEVSLPPALWSIWFLVWRRIQETKLKLFGRFVSCVWRCGVEKTRRQVNKRPWTDQISGHIPTSTTFFRVKCHCSGLLPTPLILLGGKTVKLPFFHPSALVAIIHRGSKHTLPPTWTLLNFLHHSETHPWPAQWGRIVKYGSEKMGNRIWILMKSDGYGKLYEIMGWQIICTISGEIRHATIWDVGFVADPFSELRRIQGAPAEVFKVLHGIVK